ncbi:hypothetical protein KR038_007424 [Drosophila bunnanda]|nr:hypothetical protein KR038_007424 [Drosophila bunnanda]
MNRKERRRGFIESLDELWKKECKFVDKIFDQGISLEPTQLMQFYDYVYHHCSSDVHNGNLHAQDSGDHLHGSLTFYLTARLREMAAEMDTITDYEELLIVYDRKWQPYQKACAELHHMCRYFNVNWVKRERQAGHNDIHEVYPMAMHLWKKIVLTPIDRSLVDSIIRQKKYAASLVYQVLQSIVQLYAHDVRQETSVRDKLINVFGMESGVLQFYAKQTTEMFKGILATKRYSALKTFLKYACLVMPEIEEGVNFKEFLKSHIEPHLKDELARSKGGKDYVQAILGLRHGPLDRGLREHKKLLCVIDQVCEAEINSSDININKMTSTKLLLMYIHHLMKSTDQSEKELNDELIRTAEVAQFIFDKDRFLMGYKTLLIKRQINETSTSDDLEVTMVSHLTKRFGLMATTNLLKQLRDMQKSNVIKEQFETYLVGRNIKLGLDFRLKCFYGTYKTPKMNLIMPFELQRTVEVFKTFFLNTYKNRKVELNIDESFGEIMINIDGNPPYFVKVSMLQMALLLQFNHSDKYTVDELAMRLGTQTDAIIPVSLNRILVCGESLSPSSCVEVERKFTNRKRRLNINQVPTKQIKLEPENDNTNLRIKRSTQVRCVLVRIMKNSMIMSHTQLIGEVNETLKNHFKPDTKLIKREIEHLIDISYLVRSDNNTYTYVS